MRVALRLGLRVAEELGILMGAVDMLEFEARMSDPERLRQGRLDRGLDPLQILPACLGQHDVTVERALRLAHLP
jgi:hypothetical protein